MSHLYFGIGNPPPGKRRATAYEALKHNQVRRWGEVALNYDTLRNYKLEQEFINKGKHMPLEQLKKLEEKELEEDLLTPSAPINVKNKLEAEIFGETEIEDIPAEKFIRELTPARQVQLPAEVFKSYIEDVLGLDVLDNLLQSGYIKLL